MNTDTTPCPWCDNTGRTPNQTPCWDCCTGEYDRWAAKQALLRKKPS